MDDEVVVQTPDGEKAFDIITIKYRTK
ncbi:MAG: hypothetical protein ACPG46_11645 [Thalassotalea sp.]